MVRGLVARAVTFPSGGENARGGDARRRESLDPPGHRQGGRGERLFPLFLYLCFVF